ncbi:MAG: LCP family protein [Bacillota bacterium]
MNDQNRKIHRVGNARQTPDAPQAEQPGATGARTRRRRKKMSKAARIALIVVLALVVVGGALLAKFFIDINNPQSLFQEEQPTAAPVQTPDETVAPGATAGPTPSPTPDPEVQLLSQADLDFMKNRVNILVLGIDESTERENWGSFRTDTMILCSIDFDTHDVDLISIPRDSYVKICNSNASVRTVDGQPEYGKINSAFSTGGGAQKSGFQYAMGTVKNLFGGIPVDYYIGFNMNVVKQVVDAMGGVDYDVDIEVTMNGRTLHPGMQHLDGQAVLDYSRQRKGSSDIARVDRQQRILFAIFRQLKSTGQIANIPEIYQAVEQNISTNLDFKQISALALLALQMNEDQLGRHTVDGEFLNMDSTSYWGVHTSALKSLIKEVFGVSASVDDDINAANVRKLYEESQAAITGDSEASKALNTANYILHTFESNLRADAIANMNAAVSQLKAALQSGDQALIEQYTQELNSLNSRYLEALQQSGLLSTPAPDSAVPEETPVG